MDREEILAAFIASGRRDFSRLELDDQFVDLSGASLVDADFSASWLDASFNGSDLRRVKFVNANIKTCSFVKADLRDADFRGAGLCATDFAGAKVEGTLFAGAYTHSHTLSADERPATWTSESR